MWIFVNVGHLGTLIRSGLSPRWEISYGTELVQTTLYDAAYQQKY